MNNWLIIQYAQSWLDADLFIYATTDVPVRLTLCWTTKPMRVRDRVKILRGLPVLGVPYYCFTECTPVEQDEPGDTLGHTFTIPSWAPGVCLWWRFTGTVAGVDTPSTSPIFNACYLEQEDAVPIKHTALTDKEVDEVIDHADQSVTPAKLADPFTFGSFPLTPAAPPVAAYEVANKKYVDDRPGGGLVFLAAEGIVLTGTVGPGIIPWGFIDLSAYIPAGANGVYLGISAQLAGLAGNTSGNFWGWHDVRTPGTVEAGLRPCSFDQNLLNSISGRIINRVMCGVDASRRIQRRWATSTGADQCTMGVSMTVLGYW
jgi:hypothetical protein